MEKETINKVVSAIIEEFKNDELFNYIHDNYSLEDLLSIEDAFFQNINLHQTYSTNQAVSLLERELTYSKAKSQAIVNYLQRQDFFKYLGQAKRNGRYRFDYISLFKLRMIFFLSNHGLRPSDISEILGETITSEVIYSSDSMGNGAIEKNQIKGLKKEILQEIKGELIQDFSTYVQKLSFSPRYDVLVVKVNMYNEQLFMLEQHRWTLVNNKLSLMKSLEQKENEGLIAKWIGGNNLNVEETKKSIQKIEDLIETLDNKKDQLQQLIVEGEKEKQQLSIELKKMELESANQNTLLNSIEQEEDNE